MLQFLHDEVGYNYRMTTCRPASALPSWSGLRVYRPQKGAMATAMWRRWTASRGCASCPSVRRRAAPTTRFFSLYVKDAGLDRDTVIEKLQAQQIQTRPVWGAHP